MLVEPLIEVGFIKEVPSIVTTFAAVNSLGAAAPPDMFPRTLSSAMFATFASVTFELSILSVVTASFAIVIAPACDIVTSPLGVTLSY